MTDSIVVEGYARLRDGKKWKTRWLVLRKPSPVADCLTLLVFKDKSDKAQGNKEKASVTLEEICGLEAGQWHEGVACSLIILCLNQAALLGFDSRETLQAWDIRLRYSLGEVHRFSVGVLPGTKLESGPATLHLCNNLLALARDNPPVIIAHWSLPDLRRYGPVPNGFVFEGGTRCGYWAGVFLLASAESEQISFLFDCIVRGISPTRGPFGLRPVLPDPSSSQTNTEEKLNHETQELEKRLSMLSHRSSTASSTYCPSAGGDDRSISGSSDTSDTSHSDCSIGSRLAIWTEPTSAPAETFSHVPAKVTAQSVEKLSVSQAAGSRPATKPPRHLHEIGRQSSSDSGIATCSHSSYSGSFSSYTGSLDINSGEEFGSVFSLPPHLAHGLSPCSCQTVSGHEYQVPSSLRYLYDSSQSVLPEGRVDMESEPSTRTADAVALLDLTVELKVDESSVTTCEARETELISEHSVGLSEDSKNNEALSSSGRPDSCHIYNSVTSASKTIVAICSVCGGVRGAPCVPASGSLTAATIDQSVDKSACRASTATESGITVRKVLQKVWAPPAFSMPQRTSEVSLLPKKGRDKLVSLFADLLSFPSADRQPEAERKRMSLYESMSPAFGNELKSATTAPTPQESQREEREVIYENCLKCQGEHCHPPPRAEMFHIRNFPTVQTSSSELNLKKRPEGEVAVNESVLSRGDIEGWQSVDAQCRYEEMNVHSVTVEDRKPNSKEERCRTDPAYEIMEHRSAERSSEVEDRSKYALMGSCGQQRFLQETEGATFVFPAEAPPPERLCGDGVTYVNIPVSPTSKKQVNYMELELQEMGPGSRGSMTAPTVQRKSFTRYAQIDITATETAHKVGTQHALGRQEGLHTLELRRKGALGSKPFL
ncbi:protein Dok-7 isoform X2 [Cynoglossus semilaevis]|uniref:protein Dok-7 isoform X2 n=1 Tax=Cynoglossus semilaevis TaxID=244447 RepID=UPI0007DCA3A0|nr:protein Dok-7 isoform X2 [Cynoglossus semilaevis]